MTIAINKTQKVTNIFVHIFRPIAIHGDRIEGRALSISGRSLTCTLPTSVGPRPPRVSSDPVMFA